mmetsp:Transcript_126108/g.223342  ORF Transcript_126108/g.223342 Transcript_126108/m.223342 type:complete len:174 (+) Transcript_126108:135-656(+)
MLGGYDSDDSEKEGSEPKAETAVEAGDEDEAEEEEESEEEDSDGEKKLPSASAAFKSVNKSGLEFKKFAAAKARERRVRSHEKMLERVPSASAASLRGQDSAPATKRPAEESLEGADAGDEEGGKGGGKGKKGDKMSVKERTRLKRIKGQSGIDHNGRVWKPEVWMQIRQQFD